MTNKYRIAIIPGDGIGSEVMDATISVLNELDVNFEYIYGDAGDECLEKNGNALPEKTIEIVRNSDACLFGAAGESAADVIVKLRQELEMFANLRPVKSYPNTNPLFEDVDFIIVRENTEGLYIADKEEITEDIKKEYRLTDEMYKELYENGGLAFHLKFMYPQTITNRGLRYLVDTSDKFKINEWIQEFKQ